MTSQTPNARIPLASTDPIQKALYSLRMEGAFYCISELSAPWGIELPPMDDHLMFHIITEGSCVLQVEGENVLLRQGDFAFVPHGKGHALVSDKDAPLIPLFEADRELISDRYEVLRVKGGGQKATLLCGAVLFEHPVARRIMSVLPNQIHWELALEKNEGFRNTVQLVTAEASNLGLGGEAMVTRLADVLVIQALRYWIEENGSGGWFAALKDPQVGRSLNAVHDCPERAWTLEELASAAGMSRSAFAARFSELLGESPIQYVRDWRMRIATDRLRSGNETIAQVAEDFGYESEAAFSRAFKRVIGKSPGSLRKEKG